MALDATPGSATANSYATQARATTILTTERLHASDWSALTSDQKDAALIWATYIFDRLMDWNGGIRSTTQRLRHPRVGIYDEDGRPYDYDLICEPLERATAEFAFELSKKDRTAEPELAGLGFKAASVGSISVTLPDAGGDGSETIPIPDGVLSLLLSIGTVREDVLGGSRFASVRRS